MSLPKKIDDKYIKDSVVELKFTTTLPYEILLGYFFKALPETFHYVPNANSFALVNGQIPLDFQPSLFFNEHLKIQLLPNSLVFNSVNNYIGWLEYSKEISNVLTQLSNIEEINSYTRVGVRYISEFPEISLKSSLKFSFSFNFPDVKSNSFSFRSDFDRNNLKVILNLNDSLPFFKDNHQSTMSQIDIDVIDDNLNIDSKDIDTLIQKISNAHDNEKQLFFGMLSDDFLQTLNPIY